MEYYGLVLVKLIIGFLIVITHLNISGKTQLSQMTPIDFIGNFVMGGIIGGVIYSEAIPITSICDCTPYRRFYDITVEFIE